MKPSRSSHANEVTRPRKTTRPPEAAATAAAASSPSDRASAQRLAHALGEAERALDHGRAHARPGQSVVGDPDEVAAGHGQGTHQGLGPLVVRHFGDDDRVADLVGHRLRRDGQPVHLEQGVLDLRHGAPDGVRVDDRQAEHGRGEERVGDARPAELAGQESGELDAQVIGQSTHGEHGGVLRRELEARVHLRVADREAADAVGHAHERVVRQLVRGREASRRAPRRRRAASARGPPRSRHRRHTPARWLRSGCRRPLASSASACLHLTPRPRACAGAPGRRPPRRGRRWPPRRPRR